MAHFAQIDDNNIVIQVIVVSNDDCNGGNYPESELYGVDFCKSIFDQETNWLQTSYNNNFRYNYAGPGYYYDKINDAFIAPKPFNSWILDENYRWKAPIDYPDDGNLYYWDEDTLSWI